MLENFRGDLSFIVKNEVHPNPRLQGKAYVPAPRTSRSGITLDVGVDCGHVSPDFVAQLYGDILTPEQLSALSMVRGIYGMAAKRYLDKSPVIQSIRIPIQKAIEVFPHAADKYWIGTTRRWSVLIEPDVPAVVHTALLDLTYNRGYSNGHLRVLNQAINTKNWRKLSQLLMNMQQRHRVQHVRWRRRQEGKIIMDWLDSQDKSTLGAQLIVEMPKDAKRQLERNFTVDEFFPSYEQNAYKIYSGIPQLLQRIRTRFSAPVYVLKYKHNEYVAIKVKYRFNAMNESFVEGVCVYADKIGATVLRADSEEIRLWI